MQPPRGPSPGRRLRDAWAAGPLAIPGAFNPLVARLAERLGPAGATVGAETRRSIA